MLRHALLDLITDSNVLEAVRNDEDSLLAPQLEHRAAEAGSGGDIKVRRTLVQRHYLLLRQQRSSEAQQLPLPDAQVAALLCNDLGSKGNRNDDST